MNALAAPVAPSLPTRLLTRCVSPMLFDFWAGKLNPLWTLHQPLARLIAREPAGAGAMTLVLQANRHWRGMRAGQHVTLGVEIGGRRLRRSYSPTPLAGGRLAITVKVVEGGVVSRHLVERARVGDVFEIEQAFGDMVLPPAPPPLLLLAAGSGITPMRALLRQLAAQGMLQPVDLMYWARTPADFCFVDELQALAAAHPALRVHLLATRGDHRPAVRIDQHPLDDIGPLAQRQVFACGPAGFVDAARRRLADTVAGFAAEAFSPAQQVGLDTGEVEVQLARSGRSVRLSRAQSLLEGLEAQGIRPKHGCRMGICNSCACARQSGGTRHTLTGERSDEPAAQVRLCVNAPTTDLILDL